MFQSRRWPGTPSVIAGTGVMVVAMVIATYVIRPFVAGQVGFDAAASVLYFDRIVSGRQLEAFVTATPKPLLTVVYGILHGLTNDWRPISWASIGAFGVAALLASILARRIGGLAAGAFAAVATMSSSVLLRDVSLSYAVVWAALGWLVAGLAVTAVRPRYLVAGLALGLATLARSESIVIVGLALAILLGREIGATRGWAIRPPRDAWLIAVALLAVPVQLIHDVLLTGTPFFSEIVPVAGSNGAHLLTPLEAARWLLARYAATGPTTLLALLGVVILLRRRQWSIVVGLAALGPGVAAFLVLLAVRGIYISTRYAAPIDLAVLWSAAIGFSAIRVPELGNVRMPRLSGSMPEAALLAAVAAAAAVALATPFALFDKTLRADARANLAMHENASQALPALRAALATIPGAHDMPASPHPLPGGSARTPVLLVPVLLRPQLAVDLGMPVSSVAGTSATSLATPGYLKPGELVYHDRQSGETSPAFAVLETASRTVSGAITIDPLVADPARGYWVLRISAAGP